MVIKAGIVSFLQGALAFPQRKKLFHEVQIGVEGLYRRVGAEIGGAVLKNPPGPENPGILVRGDADYGVGFSVLEVDVVPGNMLLDEGVFEKQGLVLGFGDDEFQVPDLPDEDRGLDVLVPGEVGTDAISEVFRLPDVEDGSLFVPHEVHPGIQGEPRRRVPKAGLSRTTFFSHSGR